MIKEIKQRYRYSVILLKQLVKTDFKLRYQGSVLGYLWSLLRPLALFSILYIVFVKFLKIGQGNHYYASYLLLGIVLWNFFAEITTNSISAIVSKGDLIRKINFPKYIIVVATSVSALINLAFNLLVILFFMILQRVPVGPMALLAPLLLVEMFILSLGVGFLLSSLFVRFRDLNYIWEVVLQAGFYATPILYPFTFVVQKSELIAKVLSLNPLAQIIQDTRYVFIPENTITIGTLFHSPLVRLVPVGISLAIFVLSAAYFKARSKYFAEEV